MKYNLNKLTKGIIAIFAIKLLLFSGAFIFQSCQESELFENEEEVMAKMNFKDSAIKSLDYLNNLGIDDKGKILFSENNLISKADGEFAEIKLYAEEGVTISDDLNLDTSLLLGDLVNIENIELGVKYIDGSESDNISGSQELIATYEISVQEAKNALQPTLNEAKNYLYAKGLTDSDIQYLLTADADGPAMSESDLIPAVMQLIAEEQNSSLAASFDFASMFGTKAHASQIGECAGDALGISAFAGVLSAGVNSDNGRRLLKKAIRKVASRALGWVGAAIFVYEFGDCMDWW